jgi:hypothetical protein
VYQLKGKSGNDGELFVSIDTLGNKSVPLDWITQLCYSPHHLVDQPNSGDLEEKNNNLAKRARLSEESSKTLSMKVDQAQGNIKMMVFFLCLDFNF